MVSVKSDTLLEPDLHVARSGENAFDLVDSALETIEIPGTEPARNGGPQAAVTSVPQGPPGLGTAAPGPIGGETAPPGPGATPLVAPAALITLESICSDFFRDAASSSFWISSCEILTAGFFFSASVRSVKNFFTFSERSSSVLGRSSGLGGCQTNWSRKSVRVSVFICFFRSSWAPPAPYMAPILPDIMLFI